jgi:hypothetical protein
VKQKRMSRKGTLSPMVLQTLDVPGPLHGEKRERGQTVAIARFSEAKAKALP